MPTSSSSFLLDSPIPPHLDLVGAPSRLFQVPPTPSASSALYRSISISQHRKRSYPEPEYNRFRLIHTLHRSPDDLFSSDLDDREDDRHEDIDYLRPSRYRELPHPSLDASLTDSGGEPDAIRRKRCRREDPSLVVAASPLSGVDEKVPADQRLTAAGPLRWSRAVLNVVGKVWDFCWSGPFRGFYAGGGRGYSLDPPQPPPDPYHQSPQTRRGSSPSTFHPSAEKEAVSVPGEYPRDEEEDLHTSWVVVSPREGATTASSPCGRPRARRSAVPRGRVVHRRTPSKRALVPHSPSTFSSPAQPQESPVSAETQRYLAQKRRMEREEDASLRRLNRQLQAMIQEGKQALGTRVEVDDVDMED
ncbi:hypothetical protein ARAM_006623 [Aspergillus rambellii]|uniref:Uncharacterized protein n=1 Tax=Aspergillus rambellii TaxID=308745 RepID=A0A0F8UHC7_9EURO|nr:hypothetical protein ARAM_006623 [Aspergillus rambellii]